MIETRAPGKLFVVGEYAVVEAGEPAVLVAVNRFLRVRLTERENAPADAPSDHVRAAIRTIDELRLARGLTERHFGLEIESELDEADGRKFGLGSSAAVTVATVDALGQFYGLNLSPLERYKLALLATITVSPRASGGDLAASTFGGWIRYTSPDRSLLRAQHTERGILAALDSAAWNDCGVLPLPAPADLSLLVGWTGSPASTEQLVERVSTVAAAVQEAQRHTTFLAQSRKCVEVFTETLLSGGPGTPGRNASSAVREARALLQQLSEDRHITIETPTLRDLCTIAERYGAAAKASGAGGGDCGIAFATHESDIPGILREWTQHGITPLSLEVHEPLHAPSHATLNATEGTADER